MSASCKQEIGRPGRIPSVYTGAQRPLCGCRRRGLVQHRVPAAATQQKRSPRGKWTASTTTSGSRGADETYAQKEMELALRDIIAFPADKAGTRGSNLGIEELAAYLALDLSSEQLLILAQSAERALSRAEGQARDWALLNMEELSTDALLVLVQLAFSMWYVIGKAALSNGADPLTFAMIREILASGVLWGMAIKLEGPFLLDQPDDARKFGVLGLLCCLNVCGFFKGLSYVSDLQASIMQPLVPVVVMAYCAFTGVEKLTGRAKLGVLLSSAGAVAATASAAAGSDVAGASDGGDLVLGTSIIMVQVLAYSALMVYQKDLSSRYSPLTMTACYYSIGAALTVLLDLGCEGFNISHITEAVQPFGSPFNGALWGAMSYAVLVATVFTFSAMTYASSKVSANTVSVYSALQPLFSLVLGLAVFHQEVNFAEVGSGGLIIGGLLLAVGDDNANDSE